MPQFRCGRLQPTEAAIGPRMMLGKYAGVSLPSPPATCDYSPAAAQSISNVYKNDQLGDCVIAGIAHLVGIFTGNADGQPVIFSDGEIVQTYSAIGGYQPGDQSTDRGCDEVTALNYWRDNGAPAGKNKIYGWIAVDSSDLDSVHLAMWLFENLFFGVALPSAWTNPFPQQTGFVWDVAGQPNPQDGHCIVGTGFNVQGVQIATWGMIGTMTNAAVQAYARQQAGGALYVVISDQSISKAKGKAASGFDFPQLVTDFNAMGGNLVVPQSALIDWTDLSVM